MDRENYEFLHAVAKEEGSDDPTLFVTPSRAEKIPLAVERCKKGEASLGRAAKLAGVPAGQMMTILTEIGVESRLERKTICKGMCRKRGNDLRRSFDSSKSGSSLGAVFAKLLVVTRSVSACAQFIFLLRRRKRRHVNQQRQRHQQQALMLRMRIQSAREYQHEQCAKSDSQPGHFPPPSIFCIRHVRISIGPAVRCRVHARIPAHVFDDGTDWMEVARTANFCCASVNTCSQYLQAAKRRGNAEVRLEESAGTSAHTRDINCHTCAQNDTPALHAKIAPLI